MTHDWVFFGVIFGTFTKSVVFTMAAILFFVSSNSVENGRLATKHDVRVGSGWLGPVGEDRVGRVENLQRGVHVIVQPAGESCN